MEKLKALIKLMRPHHYIKNVLIFLPIIFGKQLLESSSIKIAVIGAIAFSLMSSIVYIINDIQDVEADKKHETKKNRPVASGKVKVKEAWILAIVLLLITIILNVYIAIQQNVNWITYLIFYGYLVMNILYSIKLKNIPILDVTILAFGFLFRVIYGALITGVSISNWLYLTILAFSFYMGLGKRRNELKRSGSKSRKVLKHYNKAFLDNNMYTCMTIGIVFYSLWCIDINENLNTIFNIIYTVPLVLIICMKYSLDVEGETSGDPVDIILNDKILILLAIIYVAIMFTIIYF